jgi:hypothetical protein
MFLVITIAHVGETYIREACGVLLLIILEFLQSDLKKITKKWRFFSSLNSNRGSGEYDSVITPVLTRSIQI